jgi:hypothetical protein
MGALAITDRDGNPIGMDINAVGPNQAATVVLADENGVKFPLAPGLVALPVQAEGVKPTYRYAVLGYTPVATPTDILEIQGAAGKTLRIRRIILTGVATAAGNMPVQLIRRSAADTTNLVRTALAAFATDTAYPAAAAVVSTIGTANPDSLGAQVGGIGAAGHVCLSADGTGLGVTPLVWELDINAAVLRGIAEFVYLNMNGAALPTGAVFDITIEIQEDTP